MAEQEKTGKKAPVIRRFSLLRRLEAKKSRLDAGSPSGKIGGMEHIPEGVSFQLREARFWEMRNGEALFLVLMTDLYGSLYGALSDTIPPSEHFTRHGDQWVADE